VLAKRTIGTIAWLRVRLPGRPNGRSGWILQKGTTPAITSWRIAVHPASRRVLVYRAGRLMRSFSAVVGAPSTPTPHGRYFVEEVVQLRKTDLGAPYALALSARSNVLQEFAGGPGQIGIHGVANVSGHLGTAASHGCVRLSGPAMTWLVQRIAPGVSVSVS
jgi:lipoprotein-anchoring transpeptidase ErfK/SrfK